jgi:hypothetical protein
LAILMNSIVLIAFANKLCCESQLKIFSPFLAKIFRKIFYIELW